jgi:hypothetical protein
MAEASSEQKEVMHASGSATRNPSQQRWISKVLILVVSLLVFLEGGSRLILSINSIRQRVMGIDDSSYRLQWVRLHQQHREWTGPFAVYDPTRGWAVKPGVEDMRLSDGTILNTNSRGLRGKTEYEYRKPAGKQRIVILGDSFTFGSEVADDDTYSHYLASSLLNTEVLNLGVQGYGHDQMLLYLKDEGVKYHPDIVIVGFTYIDVYRNIENFFAFAKPKFKVVSGSLELTNVPVPTPDHVLAVEPYRPKALDLLQILREKLRWMVGKNETEAREVTKLLLAQIIATTRSIGAIPVFVYLPVHDEIEPVPQFGVVAASPPVPDREQFLSGICQKENIPCLFLRSRFQEEVKRGVDFRAKSHWNAKAHEVGGEEIKNFLLRSNLIPKIHNNSVSETGSNSQGRTH